jgi:hypothetical protein
MQPNRTLLTALALVLLTPLARAEPAIYDEDPIRYSASKPNDPGARLQQWIISVHPFQNGNGRTSRLLMDRILMSLGLPAPVLKEQNLDLYLTPSEWAKYIYAGLQFAVQLYERCAANSAQPGCQQVSVAPPADLPAVCSPE